MSERVILLSRDPQLFHKLRSELPPEYELVSHASTAAPISQLETDSAAAIVVHFTGELFDGETPARSLSTLQDLATDAPIYAIVDAHCPERLASVARKVANHCLAMPADFADLIESLKSNSQQRASWPQVVPSEFAKSLRGRTKAWTTHSPGLFGLLDEWRIAAEHDVTLLLIGETGTGKTHLARLLHELSVRRDHRFCTVACGALSGDLIESELFGYVKGAFTGADRDRHGKLLAAGRGTVLLDEIDVLPLEQQAKLLRVIETGEFEPVGCNDTQRMEARLIAASNVDLTELVKRGTFRADLYYRLNVLSFRLPPLRERTADIPHLAEEFAAQYSHAHGLRFERIENEVLDALQQYHWPGNIRELENVVRRAVLYCHEGVIALSDLPSLLTASNAAAPSVRMSGAIATLEARMDQVELDLIQQSLRRNRNRRVAAARELGISRVTLYNKMKKFGLLKC